MATETQLALAHRLLEVAQSEVWRTVIVPYLEQERALIIELMASQTDSLQLMRYAGSVQTFQSLINLESQARRVISSGLDKKLEKFHSPLDSRADLP